MGCMFWQYGGCKSGKKGVGVDVVEVANSVGSVGGSGARNRGNAVVSGGRNVGVGGGVRWRACCRFPKIFGQHWGHLPYSLPFPFNAGNVFLLCLEGKSG